MNHFTVAGSAPARAAILLSGTGSNAEALIRYARQNPVAFSPALLVTDAPETSRAREIAHATGIPLTELDIRKFYRDRGENSIKLDCARRREIREEWSQQLYAAIQAYQIDFGLLAGFVPLTNLTGQLPCLNVHPGDLTCEDATGRRLYVGLHYLPVEKAICDGRDFLRSSVILAQSYSGVGSEMDSGPVLGVSVPIPVELDGYSVAQLQQIRRARTPGVKATDPLRQIAVKMIEKLKLQGDHVIFPAAANDFAAGNFSWDDRQLFYRESDNWHPIKTIEYSTNGKRLIN